MIMNKSYGSSKLFNYVVLKYATSYFSYGPSKKGIAPWAIAFGMSELTHLKIKF